MTHSSQATARRLSLGFCLVFSGGYANLLVPTAMTSQARIIKEMEREIRLHQILDLALDISEDYVAQVEKRISNLSP